MVLIFGNTVCIFHFNYSFKVLVNLQLAQCETEGEHRLGPE